MRSQHGGADQSAKMIKKLHDNSLKLEQFYSNMFTGLKLSFMVYITCNPFIPKIGKFKTEEKISYFIFQKCQKQTVSLKSTTQ